MTQTVDDRWWMKWAREMLKYYPDWECHRAELPREHVHVRVDQ
jgi:hypothetical protein